MTINFFNEPLSTIIYNCDEYDWFKTEVEAKEYAQSKQYTSIIKEIDEHWFVFIKWET